MPVTFLWPLLNGGGGKWYEDYREYCGEEEDGTHGGRGAGKMIERGLRSRLKLRFECEQARYEEEFNPWKISYWISGTRVLLRCICSLGSPLQELEPKIGTADR
jgi:hypothetical protein